MSKLYEIAEAIQWSVDNIEDEETKQDTLELLEEELKTKSNSIIAVIKESDSYLSAIDSEIKRLQELKKSEQNKQNRFKEYVSFCMKKINIFKVETSLGILSTRKSVSTEIVNADIIPKRFTDIVIKEKLKIDKTAIKKAIQSGELVEGATLIEKENLNIK